MCPNPLPSFDLTIAIFTARIQRMTEGNIFSLFTHGGLGVTPIQLTRAWCTPILPEGGYSMFPDGGIPSSLMEVPPSFLMGVPILLPDRGHPQPANRLEPDMVPPIRTGWGYPPRTGWGYCPLSGMDGDTPPSEDRAAERVVCLLHSRRRTFLFFHDNQI